MSSTADPEETGTWGIWGHEMHGGCGKIEGMDLIKEANCKMAKAPLLIQQNSEVIVFFLPSLLIQTLSSVHTYEYNVENRKNLSVSMFEWVPVSKGYIIFIYLPV